MTRKWQERTDKMELLRSSVRNTEPANVPGYETAHTLRKGQVYSHPNTGETAGYPSHSPSPLHTAPVQNTDRNISTTCERTAEADTQNKDADRAALYMAFPE